MKEKKAVITLMLYESEIAALQRVGGILQTASSETGDEWRGAARGPQIHGET